MKLNEQLLEMIRLLNCADEMILEAWTGEFKIRKGRISGAGTGSGASGKAEWIHISGSVLNDGLHKVGEEGLKNEAFRGTVRSLRIEPAFIALAEEIIGFNKKNPPTLKSGERFGSYSYNNAIGNSGVPVSWAEVFAARLKPYKRMFSRVRV